MNLVLHDAPLRPDSLARSERLRRVGPTYRRALEERLARWDEFGRLLQRPEERRAFAELTRGARRHVNEAAYVGSPDLLESILLSVLLDLSRRLPPAALPRRGRTTGASAQGGHGTRASTPARELTAPGGAEVLPLALPAKEVVVEAAPFAISH
ncbi:MAG: hypothetical protein L3K11_04430 [Thermoplasmata archaeon]|nr:hypothetical protein [Thermoplasmata archaeon]